MVTFPVPKTYDDLVGSTLASATTVTVPSPKQLDSYVEFQQ